MTIALSVEYQTLKERVENLYPPLETDTPLSPNDLNIIVNKLSTILQRGEYGGLTPDTKQYLENYIWEALNLLPKPPTLREIEILIHKSIQSYLKDSVLTPNIGEKMNSEDILRLIRTEIDEKIKDIVEPLKNMFSEEAIKIIFDKSLGTKIDTEFIKFSKEIKQQIEGIIDQNIFADRTGLPDYALQSSGAKIISSYNPLPNLPQSSFVDLLPFGINYVKDPMKDIVGGPEQILDPNLTPGHCWGLYSLPGNVTIQLVCPIHVTHVTIDHANLKILDNNGESAPRGFEIYGSETEKTTPKGPFHHTLLLKDTYQLEKGQIQTFPINPENNFKKWEFITLVVLSNHGGDKGWTCIYRLRVHSEDSKCVNVMEGGEGGIILGERDG